VELHVCQPQFVREVGEKPMGSPVARRQVAQGSSKVTNLRHERVSLDGTSRFVLPLLDGTQSQADIVAKLVKLVESGAVELNLEGVASTSSATDHLVKEVAMSLQWLARAALIIA
jgi:methyltransferase-like protein